jgi:hypothetical protein
MAWLDYRQSTDKMVAGTPIPLIPAVTPINRQMVNAMQLANREQPIRDEANATMTLPSLHVFIYA